VKDGARGERKRGFGSADHLGLEEPRLALPRGRHTKSDTDPGDNRDRNSDSEATGWARQAVTPALRAAEHVLPVVLVIRKCGCEPVEGSRQSHITISHG